MRKTSTGGAGGGKHLREGQCLAHEDSGQDGLPENGQRCISDAEVVSALGAGLLSTKVSSQQGPLQHPRLLGALPYQDSSAGWVWPLFRRAEIQTDISDPQYFCEWPPSLVSFPCLGRQPRCRNPCLDKIPSLITHTSVHRTWGPSKPHSRARFRPSELSRVAPMESCRAALATPVHEHGRAVCRIMLECFIASCHAPVAL